MTTNELPELGDQIAEAVTVLEAGTTALATATSRALELCSESDGYWAVLALRQKTELLEALVGQIVDDGDRIAQHDALDAS